MFSSTSAKRTSFGVVEIARTLGRDKSQVSRLLRLLADAGFVEREAGALRYRIGTRLFSLGVRSVSRRLRDEADAWSPGPHDDLVILAVRARG